MLKKKLYYSCIKLTEVNVWNFFVFYVHCSQNKRLRKLIFFDFLMMHFYKSTIRFCNWVKDAPLFSGNVRIRNNHCLHSIHFLCLSSRVISTPSVQPEAHGFVFACIIGRNDFNITRNVSQARV